MRPAAQGAAVVVLQCDTWVGHNTALEHATAIATALRHYLLHTTVLRMLHVTALNAATTAIRFPVHPTQPYQHALHDVEHNIPQFHAVQPTAHLCTTLKNIQRLAAVVSTGASDIPM